MTSQQVLPQQYHLEGEDSNQWIWGGHIWTQKNSMEITIKTKQNTYIKHISWICAFVSLFTMWKTQVLSRTLAEVSCTIQPCLQVTVLDSKLHVCSWWCRRAIGRVWQTQVKASSPSLPSILDWIYRTPSALTNPVLCLLGNRGRTHTFQHTLLLASLCLTSNMWNPLHHHLPQKRGKKGKSISKIDHISFIFTFMLNSSVTAYPSTGQIDATDANPCQGSKSKRCHAHGKLQVVPVTGWQQHLLQTAIISQHGSIARTQQHLWSQKEHSGKQMSCWRMQSTPGQYSHHGIPGEAGPNPRAWLSSPFSTSPF